MYSYHWILHQNFSSWLSLSLPFPASGTNRPLSPSSWPFIVTVAKGNTNRNRCCLADLPYDPTDIWTHCSERRGVTMSLLSLALKNILCLHFWCFLFVFFCLFLWILGTKILSSQLLETRRNWHQRRDVAQFCNSPNFRDGRCVCMWVCACLSYSVSVDIKDLVHDLITDSLFERFQRVFDNSFQLSHLIIILLTHKHKHHSTRAAGRPPVLSATLLLCLSVWPYRSHHLPPSTRTHTPSQYPADSFHADPIYITHSHTHDAVLQSYKKRLLEWPVSVSGSMSASQLCAPGVDWPLLPFQMPLKPRKSLQCQHAHPHLLSRLYTHLLSNCYVTPIAQVTLLCFSFVCV